MIHKLLLGCLHIPLLVLFLALGVDASAANLVVRDFKMLPTDQTAINRETMKKDQNGKTAALIKIYTPVSTEDTYFDNGVMGIVARENKPGQIWLYIPQRSQKIEITNPRYNRLQYFFPEEILPGKTYSMELTIEGKDVTLAASVREAYIFVDGDSLGVSPLNTYLPYGDHSVRAERGSMLYEGDITVSKTGPDRFELPMEDENLKYSDVSVNVPDKAEIWFEGKRVGLGEWHARLKGGTYSVELKKENCETTVERFTAVAGKPTVVNAPAPAPFRGFLSVGVSPSTGTKIYDADGDTVVAEHRLAMRLPVGDYSYTFRKKGYLPQTKSFKVMKDMDTNDTVVLHRIQYIRENAVYLGAGFTYGNIPGVSGHLGFNIRNFNVEAGYTYGLTKSDDLYWFENATDFFDSMCSYSSDEFYVKAGYQFRFVERIGLTPQLGYLGQRLRGGTRGNGAMCHNLSIGARFLFNPIPMLGVFVTPEYAVPVSVNELYKNIAEKSNLTKGGFYVTAGISFNFKI